MFAGIMEGRDKRCFIICIARDFSIDRHAVFLLRSVWNMPRDDFSLSFYMLDIL